MLYKDRIFLYQDHEGSAAQRAFVAAFDAKTGKTIWETPRTRNRRLGHAGRDQRGRHATSSSSTASGASPPTIPMTGQGALDGARHDVRSDPDARRRRRPRVRSSGRAGPTLAIRPGGSGDVTSTHVAWSTPKGSPFVPSGVVHDGLLYLVNDMQSILTVYEAKTGTLVYQGRMGVAQREGFSASPVVVNNELFFTNDEGETFVVKAGREFKLLHTNSLGERTLASPALVDGVWYWRTAGHLVAIQ